MIESLKLTPGRIRAIRKHLGLTQMEAGKLLGGGPHAFSRYESGNLRPSAALINLLLVLEEYPRTLRVLGSGDVPPLSPREASPFEVKANHIAALGPVALPELLRRLLFAEASANHLPLGSIHVASEINAPDGGEDGRISWEGGLKRTDFLPSRRCLFQLKASKITPSQAAKEVVTSKNKVKPMIQSLLAQGGHYILLCAHAYNQSLIEKRRESICDKINAVGTPVSIDRIRFWGADQVAMWANTHLSVALWISEKVGIGAFDGINTWDHWRDRSEHAVPLVKDPRLNELCPRLRETILRPRGVLRVVGLSGIGKSRLCLEALSEIGGADNSQCRLRDFVVYADLSETDANAIYRIVEKLAKSHRRAILVVDNCGAKEHIILTGMALRSGSRLSLLTIDNELPHHVDINTIKLNEAPEEVTKHIIPQVAGTMQELDQLRLGKFTRGFPAIAIRVCKEYVKRQDFTDPLHQDLIKEFVCGRKSENAELLLKSARLLAAFGLVRVEPTIGRYADVGTIKNAPRNDSDKEGLNIIAGLGRQLASDDLHAGIKRLARRDIVKQRGGLITIEPRPIAVRLAEIQWEEWDETKWDEVLTGNIGTELNISAARRLAELNSCEIAKKVASHICRENGPFDLAKIINHPIHAEILSALAEINPDIVAKQIKRCLDRLDSQEQIGENVRYYLVDASSKIAFHSETFEAGAWLLLQLGMIKQTSLMVDNSNPFKELFLPVLGGTRADGETRLRFIDGIIDDVNNSSDKARLEFVVDALAAGCSTGGDSRTIGPEVQGSQKTLNSWQPAFPEWSEYINGCVDRLGALALRSDSFGEKARSDLGGEISALVCNGFVGKVEQVINQIVEQGYLWTLALRQLKVVEAYHSSKIDDETLRGVQHLVEQLESIGLRERARILVTEGPMPEEGDEELPLNDLIKHQCASVQSLAEEFLKDLPILNKTLPELSRGEQTMAGEFGRSLAKCAPKPMMLLDTIVNAVTSIPESERNYELLAGFIASLHAEYLDDVEKFKIRASKSPELAPAIPLICRKAGLSSTDIDLVIDAMECDILSPWSLHHLSFTWVLNNVSPATITKLLDALVDHGTPHFVLAVIILGRVLSNENRENDRPGKHSLKLSEFHPQLLRLVQNAGQMGEIQPFSSPQLKTSGITFGMMKYHFEELVLHMLSKGREDSDARKVALALARTLAHEDHDNWFNHWIAKPNSVLTIMLSDFPEIVWPLLGGMIVTSPRLASRMTYVLGLSYNSRRNQDPAILDLPEDTLFAWCDANKNTAPAFVAECLPVLSLTGNHSDGFCLHSTTLRLINEFGELENVQRALETNIRRYSGVRSVAAYYARFLAPLNLLLDHPKLEVRRWAEEMCGQTKRLVNNERIREAERELRDEWIGWL